jgi:hypothetical protein
MSPVGDQNEMADMTESSSPSLPSEQSVAQPGYRLIPTNVDHQAVIDFLKNWKSDDTVRGGYKVMVTPEQYETLVSECGMPAEEYKLVMLELYSHGCPFSYCLIDTLSEAETALNCRLEVVKC